MTYEKNARASRRVLASWRKLVIRNDSPLSLQTSNLQRASSDMDRTTSHSGFLFLDKKKSGRLTFRIQIG
jgi:hypothetical protein